MASRQPSTVEAPPPPSPNIHRWAEEIVDYLVRMNTDKQRQIDALEARIVALEP